MKSWKKRLAPTYFVCLIYSNIARSQNCSNHMHPPRRCLHPLQRLRYLDKAPPHLWRFGWLAYVHFHGHCLHWYLARHHLLYHVWLSSSLLSYEKWALEWRQFGKRVTQWTRGWRNMLWCKHNMTTRWRSHKIGGHRHANLV